MTGDGHAGTVGAVLFVVAGILIATPTDAQAVGGLNTWTLNWPVVVGTGVLALAVLAAMTFPLLLMVRRRRARAAAGPSKDKAV